MTFYLSATWSGTKKNYYGGDGGLGGDLELSFPVAASTTLHTGEFVKLSSGYVTPASGTTDNVVGVCTKAIDNSSGSAGDEVAPIKVRGVVQVNSWIPISIKDAQPMVPFMRCRLSGSVGIAGQAVNCGTSATSCPVVGIMLSEQGVPAAETMYKALIYINTIGVPDQAAA